MQWQPRQGKDGHRGRYKAVGTKKKGKLSIPKVVLALVFAGIFIFGLVKLIGYGADWIASRREVKNLRELYHNLPTDAPTQEPTAVPTAEAPAPAPSAGSFGTVLLALVGLIALLIVALTVALLKRRRR